MDFSSRRAQQGGSRTLLRHWQYSQARHGDLGAQAPFAERALGLVRGYQRDLDRNLAAVRAVRPELAGLGYGLTEVRILDLLILSAAA